MLVSHCFVFFPFMFGQKIQTSKHPKCFARTQRQRARTPLLNLSIYSTPRTRRRKVTVLLYHRFMYCMRHCHKYLPQLLLLCTTSATCRAFNSSLLPPTLSYILNSTIVITTTARYTILNTIFNCTIVTTTNSVRVLILVDIVTLWTANAVLVNAIWLNKTCWRKKNLIIYKALYSQTPNNKSTTTSKDCDNPAWPRPTTLLRPSLNKKCL